MFINFAFFLFSIELTFLGFSYILVYIGAICVLFLYVILLLNLRTYAFLNTNKSYLILILLAAGLLFFGLNISYEEEAGSFFFNLPGGSELAQFASLLFSSRFFLLIYSLGLLLIALILSIFLTKKTISVHDKKNKLILLFPNLEYQQDEFFKKMVSFKNLLFLHLTNSTPQNAFFARHRFLRKFLFWTLPLGTYYLTFPCPLCDFPLGINFNFDTKIWLPFLSRTFDFLGTPATIDPDRAFFYRR